MAHGSVTFILNSEILFRVLLGGPTGAAVVSSDEREWLLLRAAGYRASRVAPLGGRGRVTGRGWRGGQPGAAIRGTGWMTRTEGLGGRGRSAAAGCRRAARSRRSRRRLCPRVWLGEADRDAVPVLAGEQRVRCRLGSPVPCVPAAHEDQPALAVWADDRRYAEIPDRSACQARSCSTASARVTRCFLCRVGPTGAARPRSAAGKRAAGAARVTGLTAESGIGTVRMRASGRLAGGASACLVHG
jgi:hypothetical protein